MYKEILKRLGEAPKKDYSHFNLNTYLGTPRKILNISTPDKKKLAQQLKKDYPDIPFDDFILLLNQLSEGKTFEERSFLSFIIIRYKNHLYHIQPEHIETWLEHLEGWCEIDSLCQGTFPTEYLLQNWSVWEKALTSFSESTSVSKRRASLVLLCKAVRISTDDRLKKLAFENIERLKSEKDILITKAVSWLLRDLIKNHRKDVERYIEINVNTLPKIALRETRNKLLKGKKI